MANIASPLPYINKREYGLIPAVRFRSEFFSNRLNVARNLYRKDLSCHFGCVNAIEFSNNGELLVSGGDDRRVMLWQLGQAILDHGRPVAMKAAHQSNIFCLGITTDNQKIYSGGNDDLVIVHDLERQSPLEVLQHQRAVCCLSIDPFNQQVVATAGNDGRLLLFDTRQSVHESLVISRNRKPFHGVMFHPLQTGVVVSANARDGVGLWDLRSPKQPIVRYASSSGCIQYHSMSARFNSSGTHVLALGRRLSPVLYNVRSPEPVAEFYHPEYYNSCTMKSCSFAGEGDRFVLSGSDDFNLYMWKVPELADQQENALVESPHMVLYGHRSIVNQVRYNPQYCIIASSGVEKIIKVWSAVDFPQMRGTLLEEAQGSENPREMYSHEEFVSLVHHSGQYISHNYAEQSTSEDPRMMAFFDSLVQRELECRADETDSLDGSSSAGTEQDHDSDSSDPESVVDYLGLPKRSTSVGTRNQRCPTRLARLVAQRYSKSSRSQKRGSNTRRSKQSRSNVGKSSKCVSGNSTKGKRTPARRTRGPRRPAPRAPRALAHSNSTYTGHANTYTQGIRHVHSRISAPSSERTDSDEPAHCMFRNSGRIIRPLRRRINMTRTASKRKTKVTSFRKTMNLRSNGNGISQDSSDNNYTNFDNFEDNAQPSTSSGYRGQNTSALFRIAEVDSDDDQSTSSRAISPRNSTTNTIPNNLISIIPTPINGSRDSLGDSLSVELSPVERRSVRRARRNGRPGLRSDSSESPPPKQPSHAGYNRTIARLMNETNESEVESSCSTEESTWPVAGGAAGGSSARTDPPDDPIKFKQRVKTRRNYRNHVDSDSN